MEPTRKIETSTGTDPVYRLIVEEANDGILVVGRDGVVLYANAASRRLLGHPAAGPFVMHADEIFRSPGKTWQYLLVHQTAAGAREEETTVQRLNGTICPVDLRWNSFEKDQTLIFLREITDRKRTEQTSAKDPQLHEIIAENLPNSMILIVDRGFHYLFCAGPEIRRLGWTQDFLIGKRVQDVVPPEDVEKVEGYCLRSFNGETVTYQIQVAGIDYNASSAPLPSASGVADRILIIAQNVTAQMQIQREHREIEERYRSIFENSHAVMLLIDAAGGEIVDANAAGIRFYGWPLIALRSMHVTDLSADTGTPTAANLTQSANTPSTIFHMRHRLASGKVRDVVVYSGPITLRRRAHLLWIVHDVSEQYQAEQALAESEARYRMLFERAGDAIILMDQTTIVDCNAKSAEFFKGSRETIVGRNLMDLLPDEQPGGIRSAEKVESLLERALKGDAPHCQWVCRRLDGSMFDAEVTLSSFAVPGRAYLLALIRDVTERNAIEHQLERSLGEKVVLLREIHHRVKNNMQVVSSLLNLQASVVRSEEARNALRDSQDRIRSMALIHEKLYGTLDLSAVMMDQYVHELIDYLSRLYKRPEVNITHQLEEIKVRVDKAIPCGLILNELLSNALKHAFPRGRSGSINVTCVSEGEHHAILAVADNGIGMPENFRPEESTSLGLLLVNILTEQLGGTLTVDRSHGTAFRIRFPRV